MPVYKALLRPFGGRSACPGLFMPKNEGLYDKIFHAKGSAGLCRLTGFAETERIYTGGNEK